MMIDRPKPEKRATPRRKAVALRYRPDEDVAPRLVAKGAGLLADRIIEVAREHGVHVHEDPHLVSVLSALDIDAPVPESVYAVVAEVLAFVYALNQNDAGIS